MAAIWPWHATPPKTGDTVAKAIATVRNCCQRFELETLWVWGLVNDSSWCHFDVFGVSKVPPSSSVTSHFTPLITN
uniref:HDC00923 n=1 Tax=Drosophila melanogaster TaxID=7227 RepID=Q6IHU3_DROME|nr:TPA_inf: HDC00923 [Drosophila melanogaster]